MYYNQRVGCRSEQTMKKHINLRDVAKINGSKSTESEQIHKSESRTKGHILVTGRASPEVGNNNSPVNQYRKQSVLYPKYVLQNVHFFVIYSYRT
jgi:hypothetical protein